MLEKAIENHLDERRCNQSILKEISPEYSLEGLRLRLKLEIFLLNQKNQQKNIQEKIALWFGRIKYTLN